MRTSAVGLGPYLKFSCQSIDIQFFKDLRRQGWQKLEDGVGHIFLTLKKSFGMGDRIEKNGVKRQQQIGEKVEQS